MMQDPLMQSAMAGQVGQSTDPSSVNSTVNGIQNQTVDPTALSSTGLTSDQQQALAQQQALMQQQSFIQQQSLLQPPLQQSMLPQFSTPQFSTLGSMNMSSLMIPMMMNMLITMNQMLCKLMTSMMSTQCAGTIPPNCNNGLPVNTGIATNGSGVIGNVLGLMTNFLQMMISTLGGNTTPAADTSNNSAISSLIRNNIANATGMNADMIGGSALNNPSNPLAFDTSSVANNGLFGNGLVNNSLLSNGLNANALGGNSSGPVKAALLFF
jgi:hypothetical protein